MHQLIVRFCPALLLAMFTMASAYVAANDEAGWELKKSDGSINVWQRKHNSGLWEVKAQTTLKVDVWALYNLLQDTSVATAWIDNCRSVTVNDDGQGMETVRTIFNAPWPLADRFMDTQSTVSSSSTQVTIKIKSALNHLEAPKELVKIEKVFGIWIANENKDKSVTISYQGIADPGGSIPKWLSKRLLLNSTFKSFEAMRTLVSSAKYQTKPLT